TPQAEPLLARAGVEADADEGLIRLESEEAAEEFVQACRKLRLWAREAAVKL
ncbi:hypothetical protein, partial [Mesorhizobium sp.]